MKFQYFSEKLIGWYKGNYRPLPWRDTRDPYRIWLSEIILQQTRVAQGLPYYHKFIEKYPSVNELAAADEEQVLRLWQGLGYYSRARNLLKCAQKIVKDYQAKFPEKYSELLKLPGVGKYTAAAIASFAFEEKVAVVDGNVYRVLSRLYGIDKDISESSALLHFKNISEQLMPETNADIYNQGIMEFGATVCLPKSPHCETCSFNSFCYAFEKKVQHKLPVKSKKTKVRDRKFFYVLLYNSRGCMMKLRKQRDIWTGMYDLLWIDTPDIDDLTAFTERTDINNILNEAQGIYSSPGIKHVLSHQRLETSFISIYMNELPDELKINNQELSYYSWDDIANLPKPVLVNNYLKKQAFIN